VARQPQWLDRASRGKLDLKGWSMYWQQEIVDIRSARHRKTEKAAASYAAAWPDGGVFSGGR